MQTLSLFFIMRRLLIICLLCALCRPGQAQDAAQLFRQANELSAARKYAEAIELINRNEHVFMQERELNRMFTVLSWFYLFNKDFYLAEQTVRKALEIDSRRIGIKTYLAHALLFQGKTGEAETMYNQLTRTISKDLDTYSSEILTEFGFFEKTGIIPPSVANDYERIKSTVIKSNEAVKLLNIQFSDLCFADEYDEAIALITPHLSFLTETHIERIVFWLGTAFYYYYQSGDYTQAEKYCRETQKILEQTLGKEHPEYASSLTNSGFIFHSKGDFNQAEGCFLEAKAIRGKILGNTHPDYASTLYHLGSLYADLEKYEQAEICFLEAKAIREKVLEKVHPYFIDTLHDIGLFYFKWGKYGEAEKYLLEEKTIWDKNLETENIEYASLLNILGNVYDALKDKKQAERFWLEEKKIRDLLSISYFKNK